MNKFIVGLVLGIIIAGGVAYYLNKNPSQFVNKVANESGGIEVGSDPVILAPGTKFQELPASTKKPVEALPNDNQLNGRQDYDFYDILQGKKAADKPEDGDNDKKATKPNIRYYIQVGAFTTQNSANDLKARLALMGIETKIKSHHEENAVINRVITGPFPTEDEAKEVVEVLKANDIQGALIIQGN